MSEATNIRLRGGAAPSALKPRKRINLALQGGGAHGAFGWGILDKFLEDGRVDIEGLSGTSAGSMNAVVYAYGKLKGNDNARQALHDFWKGISDAGQRFAPPKMPWDAFFGHLQREDNPMHGLMKSVMSLFSPYQINPMNYNPLREVLEKNVDFAELEKSQVTKLFICATNVRTGRNMAAPLVAELLGGSQFLGFIAAVAFATILAVVAGLTLAGASALSHDIFTHVVRKGHATEAEQVRVARISTVAFGLVAVVLGILFKGQNVAFMVGLAFAVACSANFPPLLLSIVWRRFNTMGAVCSIASGAVISVTLIVLSPTIWVDLLHYPSAIFPLRNPAIVSMPLSFLCGAVASLLTREPAAEAMFDDEKLRTYLGVGAE